MFLKYMRETYFDPSARFNYRLWNHFDQFMTYSYPDCTTNCCDGINSGLNKNCSPLRTKNSSFAKIMKHKDDYLEKYAHIVKMNNLNAAKRPKKVIEKFETLQTSCKNFDKFLNLNEKKTYSNILAYSQDEMPFPMNISKILMTLKLLPNKYHRSIKKLLV